MNTTDNLRSSAKTTEVPKVPKAPPLGPVRFGQAVQRWLGGMVRKMAPPQYSLLEIVGGRWRSDALGAITRLGVPEALANGPRTADDMATELSLHAPSLHRVLRGLARDGLLTEHGATFGLTDLTRPLLGEHPRSMRNMVLELTAAHQASTWALLHESIRTGGSAWDMQHDADMFTWLARNKEHGDVFHGAMEDLSRDVAPVIARGLDLGGVRTIADLGGGTGEQLAVILALHPQLEGILLDEAHVLDGAKPTLDRWRVTDRCHVRAINILEEPPPSADLYLAKHIAHGLSDDKFVPVLDRWRTAMPTNARLVFVDILVPEAPRAYMASLDLQMLLVSFGGLERTAEQWRGLLSAGGFVLHGIVETASPFSLIEARPGT